MQFYLAPEVQRPCHGITFGGFPGEVFFGKNRVGAHRCVTAASGGAQSPEVAPQTPQVAKEEPKSSLLGGPGHPF